MLRPIGNSFAARLTVLIPLIGYFIIFNDKLIDYVKLISEVAGAEPAGLNLTVSPRLFQVYFGLTLIAIASAIYAFRAPPQIKQYASGAAYVGGDGPHLGHFAMEEIENSLRGMMPYIPQYQRIRNRNRDAEMDKVFTTRDDIKEINFGLLHLHFRALNECHPLWRLIAAIVYALGFLMLLIPAARVTWRVASILLHLLSHYGWGVLW
jgi:hypothetical protein